jgi:hypothetical protein
MFFKILADLPPDATRAPDALRAWLESLFFLAGGVYILLAIRKQMRPSEKSSVTITDQPVRFQHQEEFAPLNDHRVLAERVERLEGDIHRGFAEADKRRSSSIAGLHQRIENSTGDLRKEIKADNGALNNRITEILRELGELKGRSSAAVQSR